MLHTDARFATETEAAVGEAERATDAELVVVAAPQSGSYRDVSTAVGALLAWCALLVLLFAPFDFAPVWIPAELLVVGVLGTLVVERSPRLLRLLTGADRRRRQVVEAAAAAFHEEAVHATRGRTGLLIYLSALEGRVELVPDLGLEARVPGAEWNAIRWGGADRASPRSLDEFLGGLRAVGLVLSRHVPALEGDNPNEISDAPRIRS